jgi:acyl-CoA synthetase (NDP forming)
MVSGGFDLNMLVLDFPRTDRCSDTDWWPTVTAFEKALKANWANGAIVTSMGENIPEGHAEDLLRRGIVPILGIAEAMDAAEAAAFVGQAWARKTSSGDGVATPPPGLPALAGTPEEGAWQHAPDEAAAKAHLRAAGFPVPEGMRAAGVNEAVAAAAKLGFPVALKALGIAHKSEAGAVRLNLRDAGAVREAATTLLPLGTGLYVERMVVGGVAELIVGITADPLFGPVMTLGSGGVLVELLQDSATLILPASRDEVEAGLRGLKLFPLLDGFRGRPKADLDAAVEAILGIGAFALAHAGSIAEMDINPLIVCAEGQGAWIADALLVVLPPAPAGESDGR